MRTKHICVLIHIRPKNEVGSLPFHMFKPSDHFLLNLLRQCFFCGFFLLHVFMFHVCLNYNVLSVPCSLMITCWTRQDLLALLCMMFPCVLSLSHMVSLVKCGT